MQQEKQSWTTVSTQRRLPRKVAHGRRVRFCDRIVQESPIKKSVPREEMHTPYAAHAQFIKFGSFECNLQMPTMPSAQNSNHEKNSDNSHDIAHHRPELEPEVEEDSQFQIPCDRVFETIKRALNINDKASYRPSQPKATSRAVNDVLGNRARILRWGVCFKFLGQGHHVRECKGKFRCLHCFNFGHRAQNCVGKKASLKWAIKRPGTKAHDCSGYTNGESSPKVHAPAATINCNAYPETGSSPPLDAQLPAVDQCNSPRIENSSSSPSETLPSSSFPENHSPPAPSNFQLEEEESMAAFDIEPERFIPSGMELEDGGQQKGKSHRLLLGCLKNAT